MFGLGVKSELFMLRYCSTSIPYNVYEYLVAQYGNTLAQGF
jgi:RAB protein geranylgeranyltransferase component A